MDINSFLTKHITPGQEFHCLIVSVDIVGSRHLVGSDEEKQKTKKAIRDLIEGLFGNLPIAILSWRGDGGLILCDVGNGFTDGIRICDLIVGLVPIINRSRNLYNFLQKDIIHFRVVCTYGLIKNTGEASTLTKVDIDNLFSEKEVGIVDHVVIAQQVFEKIPTVYRERFTLLPNRDTPLDPCYALDLNISLTEIESIDESSELLVEWIAEMIGQEDFNELMIFSYTNETVYQYLMLNLPKRINIKVLIRNWIVESEEEREYNKYEYPISKIKGKTSTLKRPWAKAQTIKGIASQLMDRDRPTGNMKVDIRFYKDKPLFMGAILKGSKGHRTAFVGLYSWLPQREEGGSPYYGMSRTSMWIEDDGCAKTKYLDALISRFDELWSNGLSYKQMVESDKKHDYSQRMNIENIFAINNKPYLLIYPGRYVEGRKLPLIAIEDFSASNEIKKLLESQGMNVDTEVISQAMTTNIEIIAKDTYLKKIRDWDGHIICLCHRSYFPNEFSDIKLENSPYRLIAEEGSPPSIFLSDVNLSIKSPMDSDIFQNRDFALINKVTRSNGSKFIFVAGLHALGTWGVAAFLTSQTNLGYLASQVSRSDFAVVLECEFTIPQREITKTQILHGPRVIEKVT